MAKALSSVTVVIPARYGSSRFPGKPLVQLAGKPMIQHVYEQARASRSVTEVLVATDDERIKRAVEQFGGRAIMMGGEYRTGTDRVAAVARMFAGDCFVDLQGDEIPLNPELLSDLIDPFLQSGAEMGTLRRKMDATDDLQNPGIVKVVTDSKGYALYFSRAPIPLVRDDPDRRVVSGLHYIHLGVYIYTKETLLRFAGMQTGALEDAEKLEQLRALENGVRVRVWDTPHASLRIDTPEDVPEAEEKLRQYDSLKQELNLNRTAPSR
ncbi:MAG: 3-deoxy-manno-octulosonate cytidylyltransferase [Nitrospira sp.]|jgi:3-deoxy-manno-octulosonate cytidylyltransferase (CMP-KDO synthetase)|nr:MAG: 3-deoxy-manno-octulosonate cytidylyltransferase [Nitrospira sp.]